MVRRPESPFCPKLSDLQDRLRMLVRTIVVVVVVVGVGMVVVEVTTVVVMVMVMTAAYCCGFGDAQSSLAERAQNPLQLRTPGCLWQ